MNQEEKKLTPVKDVFDGLIVRVIPAEEPVPLQEIADEKRLLENVNKLKKGMNNVLGILEGVYFLPDGYSRNKRFYPRELWENVVQRMAPILRSKGVLGTLEHPSKEDDAHPKHASHVVKRLWIGEDGKGYGKSYVLNTPIGSLVYLLGSATDEEGNPLVPLYMSSRGLGKVSGYTKDGYEIVDPKNYILETFDVVLDPGFIEAKPDLKDVVSVVESVLPEVYEIMEDRPESFFISLAESLEANSLGLDVLEGEPYLPATPPVEARVSGFIPDAFGEGVVPLNESEVQDVPSVQKARPAKEGASSEPSLSLSFTEVAEHLSEEDLKYFVQVVESGTGKSPSQQSRAPLPMEEQPASHQDPVAYKRLLSLIESLKSEVEALKVEVVSLRSGMSPQDSRKLLESVGWSLERARQKTEKSRPSRKPSGKPLSYLDLSSVPVVESKEPHARHPSDLDLLRSIMERVKE